jgi:hypothetical protein
MYGLTLIQEDHFFAVDGAEAATKRTAFLSDADAEPGGGVHEFLDDFLGFH